MEIRNEIDKVDKDTHDHLISSDRKIYNRRRGVFENLNTFLPIE